MWGRLLTRPPELIWIIASNGPSCFAVAKEVNEVENRERKGACTLWNGTVQTEKGVANGITLYNFSKCVFIVIELQVK